MVLPAKLKKGDAIGVFSPSSPATATSPKRWARAKAFMEENGYRVVEGSLTGKRDAYRSGSIAARAAELNALLRNPEVRCVMSAIGGANSNSLLPYVDCDALRRDPKIIVGYSDMTALLLGIQAQTGLVTFYGPAAVASLGELPPFVGQTFGWFEEVAGGSAQAGYVFPTPTMWTDEVIDWESQNRPKEGRPNEVLCLSGGVAEGRLIGGNLNTMAGIWGSPWMPQIQKGDILLIEDSFKDAATVERSFAHLKLCGIFERIGGLLLGKHEKFDDCGTGRRPHEILAEVAGPLPCPALAEFDCCHTHPMLTLPLGCKVRLDADKKQLTLLEPCVAP